MDAPRINDRPGLRPPQFGLQSLFLFFVLVGLLLFAVNTFGEYATLWLVIFLLAVAAHVAGNAIGTRLRDLGDIPERGVLRRRPPGKVQPQDFAPATQLRLHIPLGRWIFILTAIGSVSGIGLAMRWVFQLGWDRVTLPAAICAAFAGGVLGGIGTFVAVSFLKVAGGALRQALRGK